MKKNSVLITQHSALCWRGAMRKIFLWLPVIAVLGVTAIVEAQQPKKVYRIGYLSIGSALKDQDEAFLKGLRELGYVEGQNIFIEWRFFKDKVDRLSGLAAELAGFKVDCIVTVGVLTTRAAKQATSTIPIVMANASDDPVRQGLVASLARPGGNVTGFIDVSSDLTGKRLELLKETVPKTSRIAILWDPAAPAAAGEFREAEVAARALGVQLQSLEVRGTGDFENAFRATGKGRADGLIVAAFGGLFHSNREQILNLAIKTRLPAIYTLSEYVLAGGLMSYAADLLDQQRRAATYVDKILKGTKPADLPVQQPTKFELIINLKTAKQIGLTIPPNVLARADKVIK
ncbi:MAG: ABC transporter substrate-binding protein [Deltaproteobacteria bacterium]|nr:MAG: ABC transporter substrate-binding protein [Deltaproteobacteria bacterium]